MGYESDRAWSDQFIPAMRQIIGPFLLEPSSFEVDTKQASDLVVLRARDQMVACRVRRQGYAERYPYEFTVRSHRDSGARTEMEKLVDGWGDWMFYGHEDGNGGFSRWWLIDLHSWRAALIRDGARTKAGKVSRIRYESKSNFDGTHFVAFDLRSFPASPPILVGSSHDLPVLEAA